MSRTTLAPLLACLASAALVGVGMPAVRAAHAADEPLAQPPYVLGPDSHPQVGVPKGETLSFSLTQSTLYPGTQRTIWVYVPAQYRPEKPACLCVGLDGPNYEPQTVFDNLIAAGAMPVTIGVFVSAGAVNKPGTGNPVRYNRSFEFDSTNDRFVRFLIEEVLPAVEAHKSADGRVIRLSADPNDRMIYGASSGGVGAFTAAWQRPDQFRRVFTAIGTYVGMRGADQYTTLVRKTEPKPLRIFLQDGEKDTWNPLFDNWYTQNRSLEESLHWAGYDVDHVWGTLGHEGSHAASLFPDAVRWLWRDYPRPIEAAASPNSMLQSVLIPGKNWEPVATDARAPGCLAAGSGGIVYLYDAATAAIYRLDGAAKTSPIFARDVADVTAMAVGPEGRLFVAAGEKIVAYDAQGKANTIAKEREGGIKSLTVTSDGALYAAANSDESRLFRIAADGTRTRLDMGLKGAGGLAFSPDHALLFATETTTHWIFSYVLAPDGSLQDKQRFYYLHAAEDSDESHGAVGSGGAGATSLGADRHGALYVATRMGVQICDRNGRVEGILTLPEGAVTSLCFGGPDFDWLYVVCGERVYRRQIKVPGVPGWAEPLELPGFEAG